MDDDGSATWKRQLAKWTVLATIAAALWCYGDGALWLLSRHVPLSTLKPHTWFIAWGANASGSVEHRALLHIAVGWGVLIACGALALGARAAPPRALFGQARFAHASEIGRAGLFASEGIVVGKVGRRFVVFGGQKFVLVAAPTRSGKGVSIVIPNLLTFADSVVVLDIKQENFMRTAGFRAAHGQKVFLFNPFAADQCTHRYNPLGYISADSSTRIGDILAIGHTLYPFQERDPFWNESARNLFLGVVLYLLETPHEMVTLGAVLRVVSSGAGSLTAVVGQWIESGFQGVRPLSAPCTMALQRFRALQGNTMSGVVASFLAPLAPWADPLLDRATAANDFDLDQLRRVRMSVYVAITPDRIGQARVLLNLFFSQLIQINTRTLPEQDPSLRHQCLVLMDEFTAIGRVGALADSIAFIAGYNLRLVTIVQSIAQLEAVYAAQGARTLMTNHALQVLFAPREQRDAEAYSLALGNYTEELSSTRFSAPRWGSRGARSASTQTTLHKRALMLPQELREMSERHAILLLEGARPMCVDKVVYYADSVLKARLIAPPQIPELPALPGSGGTQRDTARTPVHIDESAALSPEKRAARAISEYQFPERS